MDQQDALDAQQAFADEQRKGLGATDTPKILGLSKYGTALTVWESKVHPQPRDPGTLPAWLGMQLEATVAELYTTATGTAVRASNVHHQHRLYEWLVCHLDYRVLGRPSTLVECKTRAYMKGWGPDGSTTIPPDVWAQVQHEMMVTSADETHVAVLFGHHTFNVYPIPRDEPFITALMARLEEFWWGNVVAGVPPEPTDSPIDGRLLGKWTPVDNGEFLTATPQQAAMVKELAHREAVLAVAQRHVDEQENVIKASLKEHLGYLTPYGQVAWRTTNERHYVDWRAIAKSHQAELIDKAVCDEEVFESIEREHTKVKPGTRRFTFTPQKEA